MTNSLKVRAAAILLAAAAFTPWYSAQARLDQETYLGNPLPLIDWVVLFAAIVVVIRPQLAILGSAVGLIDVSVGGLLMWADSAEGVGVSLRAGLPLAAAASVLLLLFRPKDNPPDGIDAGSSDHQARSLP